MNEKEYKVPSSTTRYGTAAMAIAHAEGAGFEVVEEYDTAGRRITLASREDCHGHQYRLRSSRQDPIHFFYWQHQKVRYNEFEATA